MPILTGTAPTGTRVTAKLRSSGTPGVISSQKVYAQSNTWSVTLAGNSGYYFYVVSIDSDGAPQANYTIVMPPSGGPYTLADVIADVPAPPIQAASGGGRVSLQSGKITTGDYTVPAHASWTILPLSFQVNASVGQKIVIFTRGMISWQNLGSDFICRSVVSGSSILLREDTDSNATTTADEGDPGMYPNPGGFTRMSGPFSFTATDSYVSSGKVTLAFLSKGAGGMKIFASTGYPLHWNALIID